jgi:hypothetical protein
MFYLTDLTDESSDESCTFRVQTDGRPRAGVVPSSVAKANFVRLIFSFVVRFTRILLEF